MSWLQRIIDRDPDETITVPEDPELAERAGHVMESPLSYEDPASLASPPGANISTGKSILIVEDEAVVANDIKETLICRGYCVTGIAKSGETALEKINERRPDLVLMDIRLATGMDGIETAENIHNLYGIPVIYLTGNAENALLNRAKITEPYGYLVKPYDERELLSTIEIAFYKHKQDLLIREAYRELEQRIAERTEELVRINRTLAESEQQVRDLFEGVPIGIYRTTPSGHILDINPALISLLGYPNRELLMAVNIPDLYVNPVDRNRWRSMVEHEGTGHGVEVQFRKCDGTIIWVRDTGKTVCDDSGQILYYYGNIEDITERKQAEEALRASEQRYKDVVEDQTEFICRFLPDGTLTFINEAYCNYFRLNRDECLGNKHPVVFPPDDAQKMKSHLAALTPENPVAWITHRIVLPPGKIRWQRWSDRALFNKNGEVIEYQSVGRDITSQKEAEIQLKEFKGTLEQRVHDRTSELSRTNLKLKKEIEDRKKIQKKLTISSNEKDLLLREVHHRVKNNLQLIIGLIDLTKTRAHEPAVISTLTDIMAKVQTMGLVHTQLYESKRFDKINMKRQVQDLVEMISGFYDHDHLEVTTHIDCAEIYLPVDQAIPCALALNEIISNIHKHAFKGKRSGLVEISSPVKGDLIRFVIRDNGVGLPSGFDIEKSNRLGLRLMRTLVEQQLHGSVTLTSKAGTEVVIEFPLRPGESEDGSCTDS